MYDQSKTDAILQALEKVFKRRWCYTEYTGSKIKF